VVGGGFAGMAVAARLAKLGHTVTLHEAGEHLGGSLAPLAQDGFRWDRHASTLTLPAVLRDLFRKKGVRSRPSWISPSAPLGDGTSSRGERCWTSRSALVRGR
jgi:phytoene dehydrogenase-like protein